MSIPKFDVLTIGDYYCDIIVTGLPGVPRLGADLFGKEMEITVGGLFTNTTVLHRLGMSVGWVAEFGNDFFSRYALEIIRSEGLNEELFRFYNFPLRRMSLSFSFQHDRGFISYLEPFKSPLPFEEVRTYRPKAVQMTRLPLDEEVRNFIDTVHECGGIVQLDSQYTEEVLDNPELVRGLGIIDIFTLNNLEATSLTGKVTMEEALDVLSTYCPLVVIKCGAGGAIAQHGSRRVIMPALKVDVVDTTGAGDCFNSGFLAAMLRGLPLEACLQYGNICGGLSTTGHGGTAKAPTQSEVDLWLKSTYLHPKPNFTAIV